MPEQQSLVQFFHLTVREFFEKRASWSKTQGCNNRSNIEPHLALLKSHALIIGARYLRQRVFSEDVINAAYSAIVYAYHADIYADNGHSQEVQYDLLKYLGRSTSRPLSMWHDEMTPRIMRMCFTWEEILREAFNLNQAGTNRDLHIHWSYLRIAKVFLSSGAEPRFGILCRGMGRISILDLLTKYLLSKDPKETAELFIELKKQLNFKNLIRVSEVAEPEGNPRGAKRHRTAILEVEN
jgi:hypothetical protein